MARLHPVPTGTHEQVLLARLLNHYSSSKHVAQCLLLISSDSPMLLCQDTTSGVTTIYWSVRQQWKRVFFQRKLVDQTERFCLIVVKFQSVHLREPPTHFSVLVFVLLTVVFTENDIVTQ